MNVIYSISDLKKSILAQKRAHRSIAFVPTMGYLHDGHLSLVKDAKEAGDTIVMSIFVNPLQFGPGEDFDTYPRDHERDIALAKENGVDILFLPNQDELYPRNMSATIKVHEGTDVLCGRSRPGHFDGVATVVMKLFQLVEPDVACFGMKDAQQVAIIERLVEDFHLSVEINRGDIVRESDGLAMSSRNVRLIDAERNEAPLISTILKETVDFIHRGRYSSPQEAANDACQRLSKELSADVEYVELLTFPDLSEPDTFSTQEMLLATAVKYSEVRLIDNQLITKETT
ncbi:pantoate--beta-alanine ligase [Salisediminibacterium beveridgei]|uniref:Pantothenate synthetase n=1 Tax=Salisediminibacterium beveridgei TaxID=632773 RepID=A0A1D7QV03_9BACI|nr:pantoate--beta-alanine ligase [Salisediminibacterium beveridgei]AOM82835.1 Pantoate--beta-alanine ligase [Salisediminibacterium beveridgei]